MFLADCHTHSRVSPDSNAPMVEMAKAAWEYGLDVMCLTDHCDLLSLEGERTLTYDWGPVLRERKGMLDAFGARVDLPLGLEFGMAHLFPEAAETILRQPGLDFVIGSCHNQDEKAGGTDFYLLPYDTLDQCYEALDNYFASMLQMAASPYYDVVGHVIYPLRYMNGPDDTPDLGRYRDQIREILRLAIDSGRGMEINTWKGQTLAQWIPLLQDYKELGGEILTVGSDAHAPGPLGKGIQEAYTMMADCGFHYVAVYHERKPEMIRLK